VLLVRFGLRLFRASLFDLLGCSAIHHRRAGSDGPACCRGASQSDKHQSGKLNLSSRAAPRIGHQEAFHEKVNDRLSATD